MEVQKESNKIIRWALPLLVVLLVSVAVFFSFTERTPDYSPRTLTGEVWSVEIGDGNEAASLRMLYAHTPEEREHGLQFVESFPEDVGLSFLFNDAAFHSFWMKNTLLPLDFVWVLEDEVVDITENAPTQFGVNEDELTLYAPSSPVDQVIELNAGTVAQQGIEVGDMVVRGDLVDVFVGPNTN